MPAVQRNEEPAHLVAIPDVSALELRQRHVSTVDVFEDCRYSHQSSPVFRKLTAADADSVRLIRSSTRLGRGAGSILRALVHKIAIITTLQPEFGFFGDKTFPAVRILF
jgi:hypothetical protein